jgi:Skp family chaperone for outer membrane proteins
VVDLLPDLPGLAPPLGVVVVLGWILVRVMRQSSQDRDGYRAAIDQLAARHDREIAALREHHDTVIADLRAQCAEQITGLRAEVVTLRQELADLRVELDQERRTRHKAEDDAARWRRQVDLANGGPP